MRMPGSDDKKEGPKFTRVAELYFRIRSRLGRRETRAIWRRLFDELLERIRDVRWSEKVFWRKVLDIYATTVGYDPSADAPQRFFAAMQNKMHWAAHGQTAAEGIAAVEHMKRLEKGKRLKKPKP